MAKNVLVSVRATTKAGIISAFDMSMVYFLIATGKTGYLSYKSYCWTVRLTKHSPSTFDS